MSILCNLVQGKSPLKSVLLAKAYTYNCLAKPIEMNNHWFILNKDKTEKTIDKIIIKQIL